MSLKEKLKKSWIQYLLVLFPGVVMLYIFLPIGDYSQGLVHGLGMLFFSGLMVLSFVIVTIINIQKTIKRTERFDAIPSIIIINVGVVFFLALVSENQKFWTQAHLVMKVSKERKNGILTLYENGTFAANKTYVDFNMTYQGYYTIKGDTLYLERKDLAAITDSLFTNTYVRADETVWLPVDQNFNRLHSLESCR